MNKENKLVPELRFPEFVKELEWKKIKLKKLGQFYRGLTYSSSDTDNRGLLVLRSGNIQNDTLDFNKDLVFVNKNCPQDLNLIEGDIVICMSNGSKSLVGKNAIYKGEYDSPLTVGAFCSIMRPINQFTGYVLQTDEFKKFIAFSIGGGNINNLKNSDLEEYICSAPINPLEQNKIALCISSLDDLITTEIQKIEALKKHKKGLMQNLFPQDGETVPKLRFPEFKKDGNWGEAILDKVAKFYKGKGISKSDIIENGLQPCIRYGELYTYYNEKIDEVKSFTNQAIENLVLSNENDVIIPASGETKEDIATASCVMKSGIALGGDLNIIRSKINGIFLSYYLNNNKKHEIAKMAQGVSVVHLYPTQLKTLNISFPSQKEQERIINCINELEEYVKIQKEKIEQLKLHKKGLMQKLFPKINH